ncbi:hypothetical protein FRB98_009331 [Tulasnella sp. 332]|nr:hypothetical protein FRB98_009331 [Tulasnella sp. 332]
MSSKESPATIAIPFLSDEHATIAQRVIDVDKELQAHAVKRTLTVDGNILRVTFQTLTIRLARLTANSFLENMDLVVRTLSAFGDDAAEIATPLLNETK